ncbi:hypothetical protein DY240_18075 [Jiangella rhizosphaerae]|uniref:Uncharacterized protein n=1 Tax=Jiangella rhizosphaerae TaxID=2293569 RepID=A0A418KN86_9ACTN|nr:hypothetical protein DY240_18075 [Jiangella rhizosphaerae]
MDERPLGPDDGQASDLDDRVRVEPCVTDDTAELRHDHPGRHGDVQDAVHSGDRQPVQRCRGLVRERRSVGWARRAARQVGSREAGIAAGMRPQPSLIMEKSPFHRL